MEWEQAAEWAPAAGEPVVDSGDADDAGNGATKPKFHVCPLSE